MAQVHLIYYSPALSTRKVIRYIAEGMNMEFTEHDVAMGIVNPLEFNQEDFVLFAVPVYAGRIPLQAAQTIKQIRGNNTLSAIVCVYGNRDYDDALLELRDISESVGFKPVAAASFIARHSIFPKVASGRPDEADIEDMHSFGIKCKQLYNTAKYDTIAQLQVRGNFPYREPSSIPFKPKGDSKCDNCGTCVKMCPVHAIPAATPKKTDKDLCISCARCIAICPQHSRKFSGLLYRMVKSKFEKGYAARRESETFYID